MKTCPMCKKMTSEKDENCPFCGSKLDTNVYCPKCHSADTSAIIKSAGTAKTILAYQAFGVIGGSAMTKDKVQYVCNACGKKFKQK